MAGQDSGHRRPQGFTWGHFIAELVTERGGLAELARHLLDIVPPSAKFSDDPMTIERGLRRLRRSGNAPANKYGQVLVRCYGIPQPITRLARELGQYHSRSSDLPVALRRDQLRLWDCPPISESPSVAVWVQIALGTLAQREGDAEQAAQRQALARLLVHHASSEARAELALFEARTSLDVGAVSRAEEALARAFNEIESLEGDARVCYHARWIDQRAYLISRGWRQVSTRLEAARALYESISTEEAHPFAAFRREHGRAWCLWRLGDLTGAREAAELASRHAGDGGYLRLRTMSLGQQAHIAGLTSASGQEHLQRALNIARRLGDPRLRERLEGFRVSVVR